jgi:hypothetical protein
MKNITINNNLEYFIVKLPYDLHSKIYKEYLEQELYYSLFIRALNTKESKNLDPIFITPLLPIILSKKHVTDYLNKNCESFRLSYYSHRIMNKKIFKQLTNGDSFVNSIVAYSYMMRYKLM